ncbi:MAG: radical SAM protein [Candidatus Methanofastidiosia archaeon]
MTTLVTERRETLITICEEKKSMMDEIKINFGKNQKSFKVIKKPHPPICVNSKKEMHGWWDCGFQRECTSERLLLNPLNGCTFNCVFCYANSFPYQYFKTFRERGIVTVFEDFDKVVANQLDDLSIASCGYLSPVTDPFQPLDLKYKLSRKIVLEFVKRNLPVEVVTKGEIPKSVISMLKKQEHSFGQVSILTLKEELRRKFMSSGASTKVLIRNIERLSNNDVFVVARIDPIIPNLTDSRDDLEDLIKTLSDAGASHIVTSCLDIPLSIEHEILERFERVKPGIRKIYSRLFTEKRKVYKHANIRYKKRLFKMVKEICMKNEVTMALCMEFEVFRGSVVGLNREFMISKNCEGIDTPIYIRKGEVFEPVDCLGNCLHCLSAICGIEELCGGGSWRLGDYRRWSREVSSREKQTILNGFS